MRGGRTSRRRGSRRVAGRSSRDPRPPHVKDGARVGSRQSLGDRRRTTERVVGLVEAPQLLSNPSEDDQSLHQPRRIGTPADAEDRDRLARRADRRPEFMVPPVLKRDQKQPPSSPRAAVARRPASRTDQRTTVSLWSLSSTPPMNAASGISNAEAPTVRTTAESVCSSTCEPYASCPLPARVDGCEHPGGSERPALPARLRLAARSRGADTLACHPKRLVQPAGITPPGSGSARSPPTLAASAGKRKARPRARSGPPGFSGAWVPRRQSGHVVGW